MSTETTAAATEETAARRWAVIQTGYIDSTFNPVKLVDGKGKAVALLIKMCRDEGEARRMMKRLRTLHSKVEWLPGTDFTLAVPIYGVAETDVPMPVKKARPTEAGSEGSEGSANGSEKPAKRGRRAASAT